MASRQLNKSQGLKWHLAIKKFILSFFKDYDSQFRSYELNSDWIPKDLENLEKSEGNFASYYSSELYHKLVEFDSLRIDSIRTITRLWLKNKNKIQYNSILMFFIVVLSIISTMYVVGYAYMIGCVVYLLLRQSAPSISGEISDCNKSLVRRLRQLLVSEVLGFFSKNLSYEEKGLSSFERYEGFGLLPSTDFERHEDYVSGEINGKKIEFGQFELTNETPFYQEGEYVRVDKGFWFCIDVAKKFSGRTTLIRNFENKLENEAKDILNSIDYTETELSPVILEDPEFNREFSVQSDDQVTARFLLTPLFMERLKSMQRFYNGTRIRIGFWDARLFAVISCDYNFMELKEQRAMRFNYVGCILKLYREINSILELVEKVGSLSQSTKSLGDLGANAAGAPDHT